MTARARHMLILLLVVGAVINYTDCCKSRKAKCTFNGAVSGAVGGAQVGGAIGGPVGGVIGAVIGGIFGGIIGGGSCPEVPPSDTTKPYFTYPDECTKEGMQQRLVKSVHPYKNPWTDPIAEDEHSPPADRRALVPIPPEFDEGAHAVSWIATDSAPIQNYVICVVELTVEIIKCPALGEFENGFHTCGTNRKIRAGEQCSFYCRPGYVLIGARTLTCEEESDSKVSWSQALPVCEEIACPTSHLPPAHGTVTCTNSNRYGSICSFECDDGFSLPSISSRDIICFGDTELGRWTGTWLDSCQDSVGPTFENCPSTKPPIYAEPGRSTAVVEWEPPTAIDTSGSVPTVTLNSPLVPGSDVQAGIYRIEYTATDDSGNTGNCVFYRIVQVLYCDAVPIPLGLIAQCTYGNQRGSVCSFTCALGFYVNASNQITCEKNNNRGEWSGSAPTCHELHCPSLSPPSFGFLTNGHCDTAYGSSCYFSCFPGYKISSNVQRCAADLNSDVARWEGNNPVCEVETCNRPSIMPLTVLDTNSSCALSELVTAGESCHFGCMEGYILRGNSIVRCGLDGLWESNPPFCESITCDGNGLPQPENGGKSGCPYGREQFGTECLLYCHVGFSPTNPVTRTCLSDSEGNGVWNGETISCSVVKCNPLEDPENGEVTSCSHEGNPTDVSQQQEYNSVCHTDCKPGFTAQRSPVRRCLADQTWDGIDQSCVDETPPQLTCPLDQVLFSDSGQEEAFFRTETWEPVEASDAGRTLVAEMKSINGEDTTDAFPPSLPEGHHIVTYGVEDDAGNTATCSFTVTVRVTTCTPFYAPANGQVSLVLGQGSCEERAIYGSECEVTCDFGYTLSTSDSDTNGTLTATCNRSTSTTTVGFWSSSLPFCNIVQCALPAISNGTVSGCPLSSVDFGDECQFRCNEGFISRDGRTSERRLCQADGTLAGNELQCNVPVTCHPHSPIADGTVSPEICTESGGDAPYGTVCSFGCNSGFRHNGPFQKLCTAEGIWNDMTPVFCQDIQPPVFDMTCPGDVYQNAEIGKTYAIINIDSPTVSDNSGNASVHLLTELPPENKFYETPSRVIYRATDAEGNSAECILLVRATVFRCPPLQIPYHGSVINCSDPINGLQCGFSCNEGYLLSGPETRTCQLAGGQAPPYWDETQPTCEEVRCPSLPTPLNALRSGCTREPPNAELFGTRCFFSCQYGYKGVGDESPSCQADATWSSNNFSCEATKCQPLLPPEGSRIKPDECLSSPQFDQYCAVSCPDEGYRLDPVNYALVSCQGNGQWTPGNLSLVTCKDVKDPEFSSCPHDYTVYASRGSLQADVKWNVSAVDNSHVEPTVTCDAEMGMWTEGDFDVRCIAMDTDGNDRPCSFHVSVAVRRCHSYPLPGRASFEGPCDTTWGSECELSCARGYRLDGSDRITCEYDGTVMYWSPQTTPVCEAIRCDPLQLPPNVQIYPTTCSSAKVNVDTICTPFCSLGRTLTGYIDSVTCNEDGHWSMPINSSSNLSCPDKTAPVLQSSCPVPITATRTEVWGVEVTFIIPYARDDVDSNLTVVTSPSDLTSPYNFTQDTLCSYTFIDDANNSITCEFYVYVRDDFAPEVVYCPNDMTIQSSQDETCVEWAAPVFTEPTGDELHIICPYDTHSACLRYGDHLVTCQATNTNNGKTSLCSFIISLQRVPCVDLNVPINGALACDGWVNGIFCNFFCNSDFDIPDLGYDIPSQYICGNSGVWSPHSHVPDCTATVNPRRVRLPLELRYSGSCADAATNAQIASQFLDIFKQSGFSETYCTEAEECVVENVRVTCGPTSRRRKRGLGEKMNNQPCEDHMNCKKAAKTNGRNRRDATEEYRIKFDMTSNLNNTGRDNFDAAVDVEVKNANTMTAFFEENPFNLTVNGRVLNIIEESLDYEFIEAECDAGYTEDNIDYFCVPCITGTYFDNGTKQCLPCRKGWYQNDTAQLQCRPCPPGKSTVGNGSKSENDCRDVCHPGFHSGSGLSPCYECSIGTFQSSFQSIDCLKCPEGTTTKNKGSNSSADCMVPCSAGESSATGFEPCSPCSASSYQKASQQTRCIACPGNTTTLHTGAIDASECVGIDLCDENLCMNGTCLNTDNGYSCLCQKGFDGRNCQHEINECDSTVCLHGGTCHDKFNNYECECTADYTGVNCEKEIDHCNSTPCNNNGTCQSESGDFRCNCKHGFSGKDCSILTNPCLPNPCENNATCTFSESTLSGYQCYCSQGFRGENCSQDINFCEDDPCRNDGTCFDGPISFFCMCASTFTGDRCTLKIDQCLNFVCNNNGTCVDGDDGPVCLCPIGYTGVDCSETSTPCFPTPCQHSGTCQVAGQTGRDYVCNCTSMYSGKNCDYRLDPCQSSPCLNGASCIDEGTTITCNCPSGSTGTLCGDDINECLGEPCGPHGSCVNTSPGFECICDDGWSGDSCTDSINQCDIQHQCEHGGTCVDDQENFHCICPPGYYGMRCQSKNSTCRSRPCHNGATCHETDTAFICTCPTGYTGALCESFMNACTDRPCLHGTCLNQQEDFVCSCHTGYIGPTCADYNFCSSNPCRNGGACENVGSGFRCDCSGTGYTGLRCSIDLCRRARCSRDNTVYCDNGKCVCNMGFNGSRCELDINECLSSPSPCENGATCTNFRGTFHCQCRYGFEGTLCSENVDECENHACINGGSCVDGIDGYTCECPIDTAGRFCQILSNPCDTKPCRNGGQCMATSDKHFSCNCILGYEGQTCDINIDDCMTHNCSKNATCVDEVGGYRCLCPAGITGQFCAEEIDDCHSNPCENGGTCIDEIMSFYCICPEGYTGRSCQNDVLECASNPCGNHGVCIDGSNQFACICADGFSGPRCEILATYCDSNPCKNNATCGEGYLRFICTCQPGYTGESCETGIPANYDLILNSEITSISYEKDLADVEYLTISFWIKFPLSESEGQFLNITAGNFTFSLLNGCDILALISSETFSSGTGFCDGLWHHVLIRFHRGGSWEVQFDGSPVWNTTQSTLNGYCFHGTFIVTIDANDVKANDTIQTTSFNVWEGLIDDDVISRSQSECLAGVFGNVISWIDMATDEAFAISLRSPSECDDTNECLVDSTSPCYNGGICIDGLRSYECLCPDDFIGHQCEQIVNVCKNRSCSNGGTCRTVNRTAVCTCSEGFLGKFCEEVIIDGNWSSWSAWSPCTASCEGGMMSRSRECTQPPPNDYGRPCSGPSQEDRECNVQNCPGCLELLPPANGTVVCRTLNDTRNCTIHCTKEGYEFVTPVQPYYTCGPNTSYRWSHQNLVNRRAHFPPCRPVRIPDVINVSLGMPYPDAECDSEAEMDQLEQIFMSTLLKNTNDLGCNGGKTCSISNVEVINCISRKKRAVSDTPVTIIFEAHQNSTGEIQQQNDTNERFQSFEDLRRSFYHLVDNGSFSLTIDGREVPLNGSGITGEVSISCPEGMGQSSSESCVTCPTGTFQYSLPNDTFSFCLPCLLNTYQDQEGQTSCKLCPNGQMTTDLSSDDLSDCIDPCPMGTYSDVWTNASASICRPCPVNTYQNETGQEQCKWCPQGFVTIDAYSTDITDCILICNAGFYVDSSNVSSPTCQPCPRNTYQERNIHSEEECAPCPSGLGTLSRGSANITDCRVVCGVGFYLSTIEGRDECIPCPPNTYQSDEHHVHISCDPCLQEETHNHSIIEHCIDSTSHPVAASGDNLLVVIAVVGSLVVFAVIVISVTIGHHVKKKKRYSKRSVSPAQTSEYSLPTDMCRKHGGSVIMNDAYQVEDVDGDCDDGPTPYCVTPVEDFRLDFEKQD